MIRKLLIALVAAVALSGCASDYYYRGGAGGDYYYGSPSSTYYYGAPYGSLGYGYGGWYGGLGYGGGYYGGYPYSRFGPRYGYGYSPWYGWPGHYGWPYYYRHRPHRPNPPRGDDNPPPQVERGTGGNLQPRRRTAPQMQPALPQPGVAPQPIRRSGGQPPLRRPQVETPQPQRRVQSLPSRPLAPAPRVERPAAPPRATPAPRAAPRVDRGVSDGRMRRVED